MALSDMQDAIERFIEVKASAIILRWAINRYREQAQGPMLGSASRIFGQLTGGRYSALTVDEESEEPSLLAVLRDDPGPPGIYRDRAQLSEGTRDALYLSLRLAAIEVHLKEHPGMLVIADDLFVNLDDQRAAAGMKVLADLSCSTQVIYLTHHQHLESVAKATVGNLDVVHLSHPRQLRSASSRQQNMEPDGQELSS